MAAHELARHLLLAWLQHRDHCWNNWGVDRTRAPLSIRLTVRSLLSVSYVADRCISSAYSLDVAWLFAV